MPGPGSQMMRSVPSSSMVVDHRIGDLAERLIPGDALPLARAAWAHPLQRVLHAGGVVHALAEAAALLAAARVEVRHVRSDLRVVGRLLLAPDDPVLDVDVPGAVGLVPAVHPVAAAHHLVPAPALAVDVAPVAVLGGGGRCAGAAASGCVGRAPAPSSSGCPDPASSSPHRRRPQPGSCAGRGPGAPSALRPLDGGGVTVEAAEHLLPLVGDQQVHQLGLPPPRVFAISASRIFRASSTGGPNSDTRYSFGMRGFDSSRLPFSSMRGGAIGGT